MRTRSPLEFRASTRSSALSPAPAVTLMIALALTTGACGYELHTDYLTDGTSSSTGPAGSVGGDSDGSDSAGATEGEPGEDAYPWPEEDLTALVDPMIGSGGIGYGVGTINPGPTVPFSLVKAGPDTGIAGLQIGFSNCAGYSYNDTHLWGFAHNRFNGMGVPDFGALLITPTIGMDPSKTAKGGARSLFSHEQEWAEPGYYGVTMLDTGIFAELTGAMYAAHHRYTWSAPTDEGVIVFDLGYIPAEEPSTDSHVTIAEDGRSLRGWTTTNGGYSKRFGGLKTYFHVRLSRAAQAHGVWDDEGALLEQSSLSGGDIGAYLQFDLSEADAVELQVGLSYISEQQARANLEASLPDFAFEDTRAAAVAAWRDELSRVRVLGGSSEDRVKFYSSMYRAHLAPTMYSEAGGRYRGFDGQVHEDGGQPYYSDFSLWDTYRTLHPLFNLIQRDRHGAMMQSLVRMYEQGGDLPKWPLGVGYTGGMVGTSADIVLADAALKGLTDFDWEAAYAGGRLHATSPRPNAGRAGVESYLELGYVASDAAGASVSRTVEFAHDDYALARLAELLGHQADAEMFDQRARSFQNLFHPELQFLIGRRADGSWQLEGFTPTEWLDVYSEGDAWQYTWSAPHDPEGIADMFGGREAALAKLREYFELTLEHLTNKHGNSINPFEYYWHSNEPSLPNTYLFAALGRPDETQRWVRWALAQHYGLDAGGLPGNDDGGTMSAWYILSAAGLYPIPGTQRFYIGSPLFERVEFDLGAGTPARVPLTIIAEGASPERMYVAAAELDGAPLEVPWVEWAQIEGGATLRLEMSETPGDWGRF